MKKLFLGVCLASLSLYFASLLYIAIHLHIDTSQKSDAILILGAKSLYNSMPNPCLVARVKKGVALYKNNFAQLLIMSGGTDSFQSENQAMNMKEIAIKQGISEENILVEPNSKNTYENLLFSNKLMKERKIKSVIIVSDPYHLPRVALIAKSLKISYRVSPAMESPCWSTYGYLSFDYLRDGFALLYYVISGKIVLLS